MHRCFPQSDASTDWIRSPRSTYSSKTRPKALDMSSLEFYPLLRSSIYPPVAVRVSHNGCRRSKTKPSTANNCTSVNKLIICRCQQPSSVAVNKLFNCCRSLNQSNSNKPSLQNGLEEAKKRFKGNYKPTMYFLLCFVCCVSQYTVLCQQWIWMKCNFFQQNYYFFIKT